MRTPFYQKVYSILGFSVLIGTLISVALNGEYFTSWEGIKEGWPSWIISILYTFTLSEGNGYLDSYLDRFVRWVDQPAKRLIISLVAMFTYSSLVILAILSIFVKLVFEPRCNCTISWNNYVDNLLLPLGITVVATTIFNSRKFLLEWRRSAIEAERLRGEYLASKYQSLKDQVNPHFLFNSLNTLTYLVYENQDQAAEFIKKLSEVYRYVLDTREREAVALSEELSFARSYIFLQKIRFEESLQIQLDVPNASAYSIPPLALQMLLENAIKHNELSDENPLRIAIQTESDVYLVVRNTVRRKEVREASSGIGLDNIRARYAYLTEEEVVIINDGQHFTVKLPLLRGEALVSPSVAATASSTSL